MAMFHLAVPVLNLEEARAFYVEVLGCQAGRKRPAWLDIYFFGHQVTLHQQPGQVLAPEAQGVRHFGAVLDWTQWQSLGARLVSQGVPLVSGPSIKYPGAPEEEGKIFLRDPSANGIELKAYKFPEKALKLPKPF